MREDKAWSRTWSMIWERKYKRTWQGGEEVEMDEECKPLLLYLRTNTYVVFTHKYICSINIQIHATLIYKHDQLCGNSSSPIVRLELTHLFNKYTLQHAF